MWSFFIEMFVLNLCNFNIAENVNIVGIEAVVQRCSVKKVFLKISQDSLESTCAGVSFLIKL